MRRSLRGWWAGPLCAAVLACAGTPPPAPVAVEIDLPAQAVSLPAGPLAIGTLYHSGSQTVNLVRLREPMRPHRHLQSEETVYLVSGQGTLHLEHSDRELKAGDLVVVPRNTLHGYTPTGDEPTVVLSVFTPQFQDGDRVFEDAGD